MKITLASQSPWRKKLLSWLNVPFEVMVSDFDEQSVACEDLEELVATLAMRKSEVVAKKVHDGLIIGADTVIALPIEGASNDMQEAIGKPDDIDHARKILKRLRGKNHFVYTGVCVLDPMSGEKRVEVDVSQMTLADFSDEVLEKYLDTEDSLGKAGAYQFLHIYDIFVDSFRGSVTGVIGLPLKRLSSMLEEMGVMVEVDTGEVVYEKIGFQD